MQDSAPKRRRWALICALIGAIYAVPVAFAVWSNFPTERQINADAASSAVEALQQSEEKYRTLTPQALRRRLYRGLSDEEVSSRIRDYAAAEEQRVVNEAHRASIGGREGVVISEAASPLTGGARFQDMRPQISIAMEQIETQRTERIAGLRDAQTKTIAWGIAAWVVPLAALYFLGPRTVGRRKKRERRI